MAVNEDKQSFEHPIYPVLEHMPGVSVGLTTVDRLLTWGVSNSLWIFPMATSCCGIEYMAASAGRFDLDQLGTIPRGSPRHCDLMVIAGTITVKMAPRVKKLWDQMPEPKWAIAMGSCAISGDFYRDIYSVVPGVDTFMPVDVYVPGCPPSPDQLFVGLRRLQEKIVRKRNGEWVEPERRPETPGFRAPGIPRIGDPSRPASVDQEQVDAVMNLDPGGGLLRGGKS